MTEVFGASAGAALYRRAMLEQVGGFDASFFMYLEDVDLAWRARAHGWRCLHVPDAVVLHEHSRSSGHRSDFKYYLVGRNRVRLLADATTGRLLRYAPLMLLYDLAYVAYALAVDRSTAPLRGRVGGLREWRRYRDMDNVRCRSSRRGTRPACRAAPQRVRRAARVGERRMSTRTDPVGPQHWPPRDR